MKTLNNIQLIIIGLLCTNCIDASKQQEKIFNTMEEPKIEYLNPDSLHKSPAFSQVVVTKGNYKTVYVGGQNAINKDGTVIGKGDIKAQTAQVLLNLKTALKAGGATLNDVIKWNVYIVAGQSSQSAFEVFQKDMATMKHAPLITGIYVAGLANPDFLVEMDAIAVIAE